MTIAGFLARNELLLLFVVIVAGVGLAKLQVRGVRLGLAGVLFAGLGLAALARPPEGALRLAPELKELGLILFVYCVGLTSGPSFFAAFRARGARLNVTVGLALLVGAAVAVIGGRLLGLDGGLIAGVFCGALTNTPALGAATEALRGSEASIGPVLGYSVTYPFGVMGALLCFRVYVHLRERGSSGPGSIRPEVKPAIENGAVVVTRAEVVGRTIGELRVQDELEVVVARVLRHDEQLVANKYTVLAEGDILGIVGTKEALARAIEVFGEPSHIHPAVDRGSIDMRRVLVSKHELGGLTIKELKLDRRFHAQVTRLRRADADLVPSSDFRIEPGDRLRIVAPRAQMTAIAEFFGDSERQLADVDFFGLALGLCVGLLLARVPIPLGEAQLSLGVAGGPLLVGLVLGRLGKTGRIHWTLPYETTHALRELGLLLFLAGVGVSAGSALAQLAWNSAVRLLGLGALVTLITTVVALVVTRLWAKEGSVATLGVSSGMQTQPATLAAAFELSGKSEATYVAYAVVYPVAMIGKILLAQIIALSV
ncbi:MAG: TrkA C-terminal domain-containing protein [Polyangiaceae bacterium]